VCLASRFATSVTAAPLAGPVGSVAEQVQPAGRADPGSCGPGVEAQRFGLVSRERRADDHGGQRLGAAEGSGGSEFEAESVGGGAEFGQGAARSRVAIIVGGPPMTGVRWDK
jgi:hypothetical protein